MSEENTRHPGNYWVKLTIHGKSKWFVLSWFHERWWNGTNEIDGIGMQAVSGFTIEKIMETKIPEPMETIEENERCGAPQRHKLHLDGVEDIKPTYMWIARKRAEIVMKITNGVDKYQSSALWQNVIDSLARGADPVGIIEQLMDINIEQAEQLKKQIISEPIRCEITGDGAKELAKHMSGLKWQPVDPEKLPNGEVLAKNNFDDVLVGVISIDRFVGIICDSEESQLIKVTHYITIENLLKL